MKGITVKIALLIAGVETVLVIIFQPKIVNWIVTRMVAYLNRFLVPHTWSKIGMFAKYREGPDMTRFSPITVT